MSQFLYAWSTYDADYNAETNTDALTDFWAVFPSMEKAREAHAEAGRLNGDALAYWAITSIVAGSDDWGQNHGDGVGEAPRTPEPQQLTGLDRLIP